MCLLSKCAIGYVLGHTVRNDDRWYPGSAGWPVYSPVAYREILRGSAKNVRARGCAVRTTETPPSLVLHRIAAARLADHGANRCQLGFDPCELLFDALLPVGAAVRGCLGRCCLLCVTDLQEHTP